MKKIGLTGTIGSGKSYVGAILSKLGIPVLDLDAVAKEVRNTKARAEIVAVFGSTILQDDKIDTKRLSAIVFQDKQRLQQLEAIIHPYVKETMMEYFEAHKDKEYVVVEQAILYESGWQVYYDEVWVVVCDEKVAMQRLMKYRGYSEEASKRILKVQMKNNDKQKLANHVIENNEGSESIQRQVQRILAKE